MNQGQPTDEHRRQPQPTIKTTGATFFKLLPGTSIYHTTPPSQQQIGKNHEPCPRKKAAKTSSPRIRNHPYNMNGRCLALLSQAKLTIDSAHPKANLPHPTTKSTAKAKKAWNPSSITCAARNQGKKVATLRTALNERGARL